MRGKDWFAGVLVLGAVTLIGTMPALADQPVPPWVGRMAAYSAGPCAAPEYGSMQPGCCESGPGCFANVWDGYCQNKGCHKKQCGCPTTGCVPPCAGCQAGMIAPAMGPGSAPAGSAVEIFSTPQPTVAPAPAPQPPQPTVAPAKAPEAPKPAK